MTPFRMARYHLDLQRLDHRRLGEASTVQLTAQEMERLRDALRSTRPIDRRAAMNSIETIDRWSLDRSVAMALLRASTMEFPWVPGVVGDPAEYLIRILWSDPSVVSLTEYERAYTLTTAGGRRSVLGALALRGDAASIEALSHLLDEGLQNGTLPTVHDGLLDPLARVPGGARAALSLVGTIDHPGWARQSADLLIGLVRRGMLDVLLGHEVARRLACKAIDLVELADRSTSRVAMGTAGRGVERPTDPFRRERESLVAIAEVLAAIGTADTSAALRRLLASVDPVVSAAGAIGLVASNEIVADERLVLLTRDPRARWTLMAGLTTMGRQFLLPQRCWSTALMAEAEMVNWLAAANQLRCVPDEIEHRGIAESPQCWGRGALHVFAFRFRPPHHTAERGWMLGAVGPWESAAGFYPRPGQDFAACSLFHPFDELDRAGHIAALGQAIADNRRGEFGTR